MSDKTACSQIELVPRSGIPAKRFERFMRSVQIDPETSCWLWQGKPNPAGYGVASYRNRSTAAHRLSWIFFRDDIEGGQYIHHKCHTRLCVNPDHLICVTAEEHQLLHVEQHTHCKNGHLLTPENTYLYKGTHKIQCKECRNRWNSDSYLRRRTLAPPKPPATHCKNGHELTDANVYIFRGIRCCRECHYINSMKYAQRKREEAKPLKAGVEATLPTHCRYGHEFTPENTMLVHRHTGQVSRRCRTCDAAYKKARHELQHSK